MYENVNINITEIVNSYILENLSDEIKQQLKNGLRPDIEQCKIEMCEDFSDYLKSNITNIFSEWLKNDY